MASFVRRLFGSNNKSSGPLPTSIPASSPFGQAVLSKATPEAAAAASKTYKPKTRQKTVFTGALGLSTSQKSGIALKTLTGQ